jgi:hypothetical protein
MNIRVLGHPLITNNFNIMCLLLVKTPTAGDVKKTFNFQITSDKLQIKNKHQITILILNIGILNLFAP